MTVKELMDELQKVPPETPVRLWCDHGQRSMKATTCNLAFVDKSEADQWIIDDIIGNDEVADYDGEITRIFEIGSP